MISENNLGINLGFANNRFPEPEVWTDIVANKLGLRKVQFVADILNPMLIKYNKKYFNDEVDKTIECISNNNIKVTSMMTSSFTRENNIAHPDRSYRYICFN